MSDCECIKKINNKYSKVFLQFIRFGIVGISNTIISYLINIIIIVSLKKTDMVYDYVIANIGGFTVGVMWSFLWNNKFVFIENNNNRIWWKVLSKTYLSYAFSGIILNNILSTIWINYIGISKFIAPAINLFFSVPINFLLNKFWAYRDTSTCNKG